MLLYKLLGDLGYTQSTVNHGLFYKNVDGVLVILAVWVDDFVIILPSNDAINILQDQFDEKFEIIYLREVKWILGIHIEHDLG